VESGGGISTEALSPPTPSRLSHVVTADHLCRPRSVFSYRPIYACNAGPYGPYICTVVCNYYMKLQNVLCIYMCVQMNKHGVLIMHLTAVTSVVGNRTKHTHCAKKYIKLHSGKHRNRYRTSEFFHLNIGTSDIGNFKRIA